MIFMTTNELFWYKSLCLTAILEAMKGSRWNLWASFLKPRKKGNVFALVKKLLYMLFTNTSTNNSYQWYVKICSFNITSILDVYIHVHITTLLDVEGHCWGNIIKHNLLALWVSSDKRLYLTMYIVIIRFYVIKWKQVTLGIYHKCASRTSWTFIKIFRLSVVPSLTNLIL